MSLEGSGEGKFAQLMTNHILVDIDRDKGFPIVYRDGQSDEIGDYSRTAGVCSDDPFFTLFF